MKTTLEMLKELLSRVKEDELAVVIVQDMIDQYNPAEILTASPLALYYSYVETAIEATYTLLEMNKDTPGFSPVVATDALATIISHRDMYHTDHNQSHTVH